MHDNEFFWFHKTLLIEADINCTMVSHVHSFANVFGRVVRSTVALQILKTLSSMLMKKEYTLFNESRDLQLVVAK